jgi:hypothetical protein
MKYSLSLTVALLLATNVKASTNQFSVKDMFQSLFEGKQTLA